MEILDSAEEAVIGTLYGLGIENLEIEDQIPVESPFVQDRYDELQPDLDRTDHHSRIYFYLEEGEDPAPLIARIQEELSELRKYTQIGSGTVTAETEDDSQWRDKWKEFFHSFETADFFIRPTWENTPVPSGRILIEMDPGVSFGTGKHESTQLVLRRLSELVQPGDRVLDVGCGSGILSIAALKKGAGSVTCIDIDPDCLASTKENFLRNQIPLERTSFFLGNLSEDQELAEKIGQGHFRIAAANLLADILIPMADRIYDALEPGGILIGSGIIDFKLDETADALARAGFCNIKMDAMGEWRSLTAQKKAGDDNGSLS